MRKENKENCRVLVSACLLGLRCRYNAERKAFEGIERLMDVAEVIPICPEVYGGLPTPRPASERRGEGVFMSDGTDVTAEYHLGAEETLRVARMLRIKYALLKERSPSCGSGEIYDGTFSHTRISGDGVTAELLKRNGVFVFGESQTEELISILNKETEQ